MELSNGVVLRWASLPEFAAVPDGWQLVPLLEIADLTAGQSPPSQYYNDKADGLPFLQGCADFGNKYPNPKVWCSRPNKTCKRGATLLSVRAPVGESNRADQSYALGRGVASLTAMSADADFLHHGMGRWRVCLQRVAQGTTFDAVTAKHFGNLRVLIPVEKNEQQAIARILDAVDVAIERTRTAIATAEKLKRAVVQNFFEQGLGRISSADRPGKKLRKGWRLAPTRELLARDPKNGISPVASPQPPGFPTFSIAAVRNGKIDLMNEEHRKYVRIRDEVAAEFAVKRGDLLIVRGNANPELVGRCGMVADHPEGCIYPDILKRVVFHDGDDGLIPAYACITWNHSVVHNQVLKLAKTSNGTLKINSQDVKRIIMPVAPKPEQEQLVELVARAEESLQAYQRRDVHLERLKRGLMQDLLTGRVRVKLPAHSGNGAVRSRP